jgi:hypothetical protein
MGRYTGGYVYGYRGGYSYWACGYPNPPHNGGGGNGYVGPHSGGSNRFGQTALHPGWLVITFWGACYLFFHQACRPSRASQCKTGLGKPWKIVPCHGAKVAGKQKRHVPSTHPLTRYLPQVQTFLWGGEGSPNESGVTGAAKETLSFFPVAGLGRGGGAGPDARQIHLDPPFQG